jgi:hypothetical protein
MHWTLWSVVKDVCLCDYLAILGVLGGEMTGVLDC